MVHVYGSLFQSLHIVLCKIAVNYKSEVTDSNGLFIFLSGLFSETPNSWGAKTPLDIPIYQQLCF